MTDLRTMIEFASVFVENRFAVCGVITPLWHCVRADGEHFVMAMPPGDKDVSTALVRAYFELKQVVRCLYIDEAWIADTETREEMDRLLAWMTQHGGRIADFPGRFEAIAFAGEDISGQMLTAHRRIDRTRRKPTLGPLQINDLTSTETTGRMVGMLSHRGATVQ